MALIALILGLWVAGTALLFLVWFFGGGNK